MDTIDKVKEFHETFELPHSLTPQVPTKEIVELRLRLIVEELVELAQASGCEGIMMHVLYSEADKICEKQNSLYEKDINPNDYERVDLVEALDAFCDLRYVLDGAMHCYGMDKIFNEAFEEVHESNMSKLWKKEEMLHYQLFNKQQRYTFTQSSSLLTANYYIARREDGKVVKSPSYNAVRKDIFEHLLNKHNNGSTNSSSEESSKTEE